MAVYVIDFETYWDAQKYTLSKMGPIEYVRDQRFVPQLLAVMRLDETGPTGTVTDDVEGMRRFLQTHCEDALVGHNIAGFDALVLSEYFGVKPKRIYDTIGMMNWIGYSRIIPRSHAALTELLGNGTKKAGTVVSSGKQWPQDFSEMEQRFFAQYCHDDAEQCARNTMRMLPFMSRDALLFMSITARMATEPVFELDEKLLEEYIAEIDAKVEQARKDLLSIFHFTSEGAFLTAIRSSAKFAVMLTALGVEPPMKESEAKTKTKKAQLEMLYDQATTDAERATIRQRMETELPVMTYAFSKTDLSFLALREHPDMRVQMLVNARLDHNTSIDRSRAERLLFFARQHKPVPIMLSAWNAHTGRYTAGAAEDGGSSDKLQFQNLSKRDPSKAKLRQAIHAPAGYKVVACDSGQVEARCLAWAANETGLVAQFREGRDPYSELAETVFQVPHEEIFYGAKHGDKTMKRYRTVGKTAILSCFAGSTEVLTDKGWKSISTVSINDKLWDGESWVNHEGLICNGERTVTNLAGLEVTPDHLIYDGFSWKTVAELQNEPLYLKSAILYATEQSLTALWNNVLTKNVCFTNADVTSAEHYIGTMDTHFPKGSVPQLALIAVYVTELIYGAIQDSTLTPKLGNVSEPLQSCEANDDCVRAERTQIAKSICRLFSVIVVQNLIGCYSQILEQGELLGVTYAQRNNRIYQDTGLIMRSASLSFLTPACVKDTFAEYMYADSDAKIRRTQLTNTMEHEVLSSVSRMLGIFFSTYLHLKGGMTHPLSLTASTITEITKEVTCEWLHVLSKCITDVQFLLYKQRMTNSKKSCNNSKNICEKVYDIRNAGPNHRFVVRSRLGWLWGHNCGYGVGAQKFSDTLARQGARLSEDPDKHREMAFNAHAIYRAAHPNIVRFWSLCGNVIKDMEAGYSGEFGGPDGKLFKFGTKEMGDCGRQVPYILLPNGYHLWYPNLRVENDNGKVQYFYDRPRGKNVIKTKIYGGSCTENCIQSLAFMILAWQACRMYEAGIQLAANIHDSFATVVPEDKAEETGQLMYKIMTTCPPWASTLPLFAEVEIGRDFGVV